MADKKHQDSHKQEGNPSGLPGHSSERNDDITYEKRDVRITSILKFGAALAFGTALTLFGMRFLFDYFDTRENADKIAPITQVEGIDKNKIPPEPRLQGIPEVKGFENPPTKDMEEYLAKEELRLGTKQETDEHGVTLPFQSVVTDPANNLVTIPIDRAMKEVLAKGFKVDPNAPTSDQPNAVRRIVNDEEIPASSSSGRTMQKLRRQ